MELDVDFCINIKQLYTEMVSIVVMLFSSSWYIIHLQDAEERKVIFLLPFYSFRMLYLMHDGFMQFIDKEKIKPEIAVF